MEFSQLVLVLVGLAQIALGRRSNRVRDKLRWRWGNQDPEITMDAVQLIRYWGYPGEEHTAETSDGYQIKIHRIPYGNGQQPGGNRPVIFLQHGLECSSTNWLTNLPNEAAGFVFADAGFDVWMGNVRGNTYGLKNINFSIKDHRFWEFSWDEMAAFDLDATINLALSVSNASQLYYMGHSQGTLTAFAKFSSDIEFGKKIKKLFALGPVATVKHIKGALSYLALFTRELEFLLNLIGYDQFLPNNKIMDLLAKLFCGGSTIGGEVCEDILFLVAGPNSHQTNQSRIPVYIGHTPAGTSSQNVIHFLQMVNSGLFQKYNFGENGNLKNYGQPHPPVYDLTKMQVPTALFWGDLDWLADPQDIKNSIIPYIQNLIGNYEYSDFNHLDFIWGLNAASQVYDKVIQIIRDDL